MFYCVLVKGNSSQKNLGSYPRDNFNDFIVLEKSNYLLERLSSTIHIYSFVVLLD